MSSFSLNRQHRSVWADERNPFNRVAREAADAGLVLERAGHGLLLSNAVETFAVETLRQARKLVRRLS
jgi:pyridoxine 5'-phosphate synthase PdxJ